MKNKTTGTQYDIAIIGGLGHVGLPLGIAFAATGQKVLLVDLDKKKMEQVLAGIMPFLEYGADEILPKVVRNGTLRVSLDSKDLSKAKSVIVAIGTPVDEYMNPKTRQFLDMFDRVKSHLSPDQLVVIRSTVYPQTCRELARRLAKEGRKIDVAYCPERIVQAHALEELRTLPQIVSGLTEKAAKRAEDLFRRLSPKIIGCSVEEAELAKLFSNAHRYIQFATANQFYIISKKFGVDYDSVRRIMTDGYGRSVSLPKAGFAAGPCLLKDTMQLAAFSNNSFFLGHAAMMVNEGLPNFVVDEIEKRHKLAGLKVGILGMTFKADCDDIRDSLSYKLGKILRFRGAEMHYSDEFAKDPTFESAQKLLSKCRVVVLGVPHSAYRELKIPRSVDLVDVWGFLGKKA